MATHPPTPSTIYFATGNKKKLEEVCCSLKHQNIY
jgi:inosine/xanthosine triphosphate pyrophosphatase family protein